MVYHPARQRCPIGARLGASPVVAGLTGLSASRSPSGWRNRWRRRDRSSATTPRAVLSGVDHTAPPHAGAPHSDRRDGDAARQAHRGAHGARVVRGPSPGVDWLEVVW